jgi:phosphorylcholine metabolism protein LicD
MKIYGTFIIYVAFVSPAFNQHRLIPGTNYPFLSEIITFKCDTSDFFIQIFPVDSTIDLSAVPPEMDQEFIRKQLISSLNSFRKKSGKKPLKYSLEISDNLAYVFEKQASEPMISLFS